MIPKPLNVLVYFNGNRNQTQTTALHKSKHDTVNMNFKVVNWDELGVWFIISA